MTVTIGTREDGDAKALYSMMRFLMLFKDKMNSVLVQALSKPVPLKLPGTSKTARVAGGRGFASWACGICWSSSWRRAFENSAGIRSSSLQAGVRTTEQCEKRLCKVLGTNVFSDTPIGR